MDNSNTLLRIWDSLSEQERAVIIRSMCGSIFGALIIIAAGSAYAIARGGGVLTSAGALGAIGTTAQAIANHGTAASQFRNVLPV